MRANEELHERLVILLRAVNEAEGFSDDDVKTLCYACGIDSNLVIEDLEKATVPPTPLEWYDSHLTENDLPW